MSTLLSYANATFSFLNANDSIGAPLAGSNILSSPVAVSTSANTPEASDESKQFGFICDHAMPVTWQFPWCPNPHGMHGLLISMIVAENEFFAKTAIWFGG